MKDFPFFTTQNGAAGLCLQEVPYNHKAYITIHDTQDLAALLQECVDFCNAVGAQEIYACNHGELSVYPVYARILAMERAVAGLPETNAEAVSVTTQELSRFQEIYNQKMKNIPAARYLTNQRTRSLLQEENCFFIYENEYMIGIGIASDGMISAIASVRPGAGKDIVLALRKGMTAERVSLEVAEENTKALRLYERLGFSVSGVKNIWYKIK